MHVRFDDVLASPPLQLRGRALGHRSAVVDDHDVRRQVVGLVEVLGGEQDVGAPAHQPLDGLPQVDPAPRVQAAGGLVQQQQPGLAHEARTQVELAAHAPRVRADQPVGRLLEAQLFQHRGRVPARGVNVLAE